MDALPILIHQEVKASRRPFHIMVTAVSLCKACLGVKMSQVPDFNHFASLSLIMLLHNDDYQGTKIKN